MPIQVTTRTTTTRTIEIQLPSGARVSLSVADARDLRQQLSHSLASIDALNALPPTSLNQLAEMYKKSVNDQKQILNPSFWRKEPWSGPDFFQSNALKQFG